MIGEGSHGYAKFRRRRCSTGHEQKIIAVSSKNLPDRVDIINESINWTVEVCGKEHKLAASGPHRMYLTYGFPIGSSEFTERRLRWACEQAGGAQTAREVADKIHDALADSDPPYEHGERDTDGSGWPLLSVSSDKYGECHDQARLMALGVEILGVDARPYIIYASTDNNITKPESKQIDGKLWWLLFDFDGNGKADNYFEGAVEIAGHHYTVVPKYDADSACSLLGEILYFFGADQVWARSTSSDEFGSGIDETRPGTVDGPKCAAE